jgi:hypothetical protein
MKQPVFINNNTGLNKDEYMSGVRRIEKAVGKIKLNIYNRNPLDDWMNSSKSWSDFI